MAIGISDFVFNVLIIGASFVALNWASNLTINNAVKVSKITKLGKTAVGFSIIAFSTSLPELTVAVLAAVYGGASLSVGNVLGSNIVNITVIIGLAAFIFTVRNRRRSAETVGYAGNGLIPKFAKEELSSIHFGLLVSSTIPLVLIYISEATWIVGLILILIFLGYMYQLSKVRMPEENGQVTSEDKSNLRRYGLFTLVGVLGVVISANFLVDSAISIAQNLGIPRIVIGATIVAIGTSLPELTLDLKSFLKGHPGLAFGDIIGSSFVNITLILGISLFLPAVLGSAVVMSMGVYMNLIIFSIVTNLFFWYFLSQGKLTWKEGAIFLFIYALFLVTTLAAA